MAIFFNCLGALLLILLGILQFTKIWDQPDGRNEVSLLACLAGVCLIASAAFQIREKRKEKREQAERDGKLPGIIEAVLLKYTRTEQLIPVPTPEEKTESTDTLPPQERLKVVQEEVFIADVLNMPLDDLKLSFGHDSEFRDKFKAVPQGKNPSFDARRTSLLDSPLIAAKFIRAHLFPRSPFAEMIKSVFQAAGKPDFETTSDFLFDIHAVNVTNVATTLQDVIAEAEIDGEWIRLERIDDLSDYEQVFRVNKDETHGGMRFSIKGKVEELSSFWDKVRNSVLQVGIGHDGWMRFELNTTNKVLEKSVNHRVRIIDALGGTHPVMKLGPNAEGPDIRHNLKK
jgi:hypothetical protein